MAGNIDTKRRIVPAAGTTGGIVKIDRVNSVTGMLDRALNIIDEQLTKIALKSRAAGPNLDEKDAKILQGYVRSLVELSKEEREREKSNKEIEGLDKLTNEELLDLGKEALLGLKDSGTPKS